MQNRPSEALKTVADELAELLCSQVNEQLRKKELFDQLSAGKTADEDNPAGSPPDRVMEDGMIGIWKPVEHDGQTIYQRDPLRQAEWHLWARVHEIKPKGDRNRIILLGESAARGFLYDPYYNVARELEGICQSNGAEKAEVIDLARTGILPRDLLAVTRASLALEPDALVIFAGNNWVYSAFEHPYDFNTLFELYKKDSFTGVRSILEEEVKKTVMSFFETVKEIMPKSIPVILVIPEFNLRDWTSNEMERILPWSPHNNIAEWLRACDRAEKAVLDNRTDRLERAASRMVMLDPSNPYGYELLANAYLRKNLFTRARACLEASRDTILFNRSNTSMPRCIGVVRATMLQEASLCSLNVIDLPEVFATETGNPVPDRSLFLDNCHLTIQGIKIAMRSTAQILLKQLTGVTLDADKIKDSGIDPDDNIQAIAHFSAAIYNAHHGQSYDVIQDHCRKAVAFSPKMTDTMMRYMDFSSRKAPTLLCGTFREMIVQGELVQYEDGGTYPYNSKLLDIDLVNAMLAALPASETNRKKEICELRRKEHVIGAEGLDLLQSYYRKTSYHEFSAGNRPDYIQMRSTKCRFHFIPDPAFSLSFRLIYRTPGRTYDGLTIRVYINDNPRAIAQLPMNASWCTGSFTVGQKRLRPGVNVLKIVWPYTSEPIAIARPVTADSFLKGIFPVLGEIHTFKALARR